MWGWLVGSGDTLTSISNETGVSINQILGVNPQITDPDMIYSGDRINIPREVGIKAFEFSTENVGNKAFGFYGAIGNYRIETNKCTAFLGYAYTLGAGVTDYPTQRSFWGRGPERYELTDTFLSGVSRIGPFQKVESPRLGDLAILDPLPGDVRGHAMVKGLGDTYIGASTYGVVIRTENYLKGMGYNWPPTYWRYGK